MTHPGEAGSAWTAATDAVEVAGPRPAAGMDDYAPSLTRRDTRRAFARAVAIAHGVGVHLSVNQLIEHVLEHGLPPSAERERMLAEKLAEEEGGTTPPSSPPNG